MVTKKTNKAVKKPTVKKASQVKIENEKTLDEIIDKYTLEGDLEAISKTVKETKQKEEKKKNKNLFQTMKDIIWF